MVIGALLSIAAIAAVTEEIAFREYIQKPLEDAYGIVPAVLIVGIMFWVACQRCFESGVATLVGVGCFSGTTIA